MPRSTANEMRQPVAPEVGEREQHDRQTEPGPEREREHAGGEGPGSLGRVLDRGDPGDDQRGVHERAGDELGTGEHLECRGQRGEHGSPRTRRRARRGSTGGAPSRSARAMVTNETSTPARADREGDAERLVRATEGAGDGVAVLGEERPAEVGEQRHRRQRAEPRRLFGGEGHRRHHGEGLHGRRGLVVRRTAACEAGDGVGEGTAGAEPRLQAQEPGEERDDHRR